MVTGAERDLEADEIAAQDEAELAANMKIVGEIQEGFRNPVTVVAFRAGFLACREIMARFIEQGGDAATAASIRANWHPGLQEDPGTPRLFDFSELVDGGEDGPGIGKSLTASREASAYASQVLTALGVTPALP